MNPTFCADIRLWKSRSLYISCNSWTTWETGMKFYNGDLKRRMYIGQESW